MEEVQAQIQEGAGGAAGALVEGVAVEELEKIDQLVENQQVHDQEQ